jgi:hypothetical protein
MMVLIALMNVGAIGALFLGMAALKLRARPVPVKIRAERRRQG